MTKVMCTQLDCKHISKKMAHWSIGGEKTMLCGLKEIGISQKVCVDYTPTITLKSLRGLIVALQQIPSMRSKTAIAANDKGLELLKQSFPSGNLPEEIKSFYGIEVHYIKKLDCLGGILVESEEYIKNLEKELNK